MVHLNGSALPERSHDHARYSSNLFDDLRYPNNTDSDGSIDPDLSDAIARRPASARSEDSLIDRSSEVSKPSRQMNTARRPRPLLPRSLKEARQLAELLSTSKLVPKGFDTPKTCLVGILYGMELGLSPISALQRMAVIEGRPTIWGDAALSLVQSSGLLQSIREDISEQEDPNRRDGKDFGDGTYFVATCAVQRSGRTDLVVSSFSEKDAKRAGLWQKKGPWTDYPKRMLTMRARAFALRDAFPDVLAGLYIREEFEGMDRQASPNIEQVKPANNDEDPSDIASRLDQSSREEFPKDARSADRQEIQTQPFQKISTANDDAGPSRDVQCRGNESREQKCHASHRIVRRAPPPPDDENFLLERQMKTALQYASDRPECEGHEFGDRQNQGGRQAFAEAVPSVASLNSDEAQREIFDPEIILDLFDSALCCARDVPTFEEIVDDFSRRLYKLSIEDQQRAKMIFVRHQKRVQDLDACPRAGQSDKASQDQENPSEFSREADHALIFPRHETVSEIQLENNTKQKLIKANSILPKGLKALLPNLGIGSARSRRRIRKEPPRLERARGEWNARTRLVQLELNSDADEVSITDQEENKR